MKLVDPSSDTAAPAPGDPALSPLPVAPRKRLRDSLALEAILWLTVLAAAVLAAIALLMGFYGKRLVLEESRRRIEETGNRSVEELQSRSREISSLVRTLSQAVPQLPKVAESIQTSLPPLIDFQGDAAVAGGGYWPEPKAFDPALDRSSFFWGRDGQQKLQPIDDYNDPFGPGYHNEEWYVPVKHLPSGRTFWSRSYTDPYTYEPMVTCTGNVYEAGKFVGTTTIDLRLSGLRALAERWQKGFGGYAFLVDRNNKFLTFPKAELVRQEGFDDKGNKTSEFIYTKDLAKKEARFIPIADALDRMDADIRARAVATRGFDPTLAQRIDAGSYAIGPEEAAQIAAVMVDPLAEQREEKGYLHTWFAIPDDLIHGESSFVFVFNVPDSYWKLVIVTPQALAGAVATRISRLLLFSLAAAILPLLFLAFLYLRRKLIRPITSLAAAAAQVREGNLEAQVPVRGGDELGRLSDSFNRMVARLRADTVSLKRANTDLERSLAMTDTIMSTVHEGLFLLEPDLRIAPKYSAALRSIFGDEELAGADFLELLRRITPAKTHDLTARFLKLLFNPTKTDSVVAKINPLKEVEASFPGKGGQLEQKFLNFTFDRIRADGKVGQAMVTVADVSARVQLARQLAEQSQRMERQSELLISVMHVEPDMLRDFIDGAHAELERINETLREGSVEGASLSERQATYRRLADQIFQSVHSIKGTASMLRIDYFAQAAHRFEEKVNVLRGRSVLDGNDFLPIVLELSEMVDGLIEIREVIQRFAEVKQSQSEETRDDAAQLAAVLERFVSDLSAKHEKLATFSFQAAGRIVIPFRFKTALRNTVAQLARNSLAHGIESPAERRAAGKPEQGSVLFAARRREGQLEFLYRDDGRGFDYRQMVERAKDLARLEPELLDRLIDREQNRWRNEALDALVFHPGFTTASVVTETAGRGMGLAAVKDQITALGGTITVRQKPGQFCEFHLVLPV